MQGIKYDLPRDSPLRDEARPAGRVMEAAPAGRRLFPPNEALTGVNSVVPPPPIPPRVRTPSTAIPPPETGRASPPLPTVSADTTGVMSVAWVPSELMMSVCSVLLRLARPLLAAASCVMKRPVEQMLLLTTGLGLASALVIKRVVSFACLLGNGTRGEQAEGLMNTADSAFTPELNNKR